MIWFYSDDPVRDAERYDAWLDSRRDEEEYEEYSHDDDFDEDD